METLFNLLSGCRSIALTGGGGKTTLMWRTARHFAAESSVLVSTSTHVFAPLPGQCDRATPSLRPQNHILPPGITALLRPAAEGRCEGFSAEEFKAAKALCNRIIYEADGSRRLPLKVHAAHEPVVYSDTEAVLFLMGLSALGQPVGQVCHRYELLCEPFCRPETPVTPELYGLLAERAFQKMGRPAFFRVLLTQKDLVSPACCKEALSVLEKRGFESLALCLI